MARSPDKMMKAVVIHEHGGPEQLRYEDVPRPQIGPYEVLVQVKAAALNHLDLWIRAGLPNLKLQMPHILGSDAAGMVVEVGEFVTEARLGDAVLLAPAWGCGRCAKCLSGNDHRCKEYRILGEHAPGVYAEYVKAPSANVFPIPEGLTFDEAAAIPLVTLTAWQMLVEQVRVQPDDTVLILAAGSGVGSAGIQIAKLFGARVIATAGTDAKLAKARELGADEVVHHYQEDILEAVQRLTGKKGVDVVFEHVGKATWGASIRCLKRGGRLVTCGATTGYDATTDLRYVFFKELKILGNFMGPKAGLHRALQFFPDRLHPVVDRAFSLEDAVLAHERLMNREQFGKVILNP